MSRGPKHSAKRRASRRHGARVPAPRRARDPQARKHLTQRGLILLLLLGGLLFSSVYPMKRYFAVRATTASLHREERALDRQAADLRREKQRLKTDAAVEQIAREDLAMVRPGEIPYVVVGQDAPKTSKPAQTFDAEPATRRPSLFSRWWAALERATRAVR